jgi:hypothetical protein
MRSAPDPHAPLTQETISEPGAKSDGAPSIHAAASRPTVSRFWLGFVLGFLLLTLVSCGAGVALFVPRDFSLADIQGNPGEWTPPPTPTISATDAEIDLPAPDAPFAPGRKVRNVTNSLVNLRATPGYLSKPAGDVLAQLQPGDVAEITGASQASDGLTWRPVRYQEQDGRIIEGWIAEATASGVTILAPAE